MCKSSENFPDPSKKSSNIVKGNFNSRLPAVQVGTSTSKFRFPGVPQLPPELLVLNRFGIDRTQLAAAQTLSEKLGVSASEILIGAGVISRELWESSQAMLENAAVQTAARSIERKYLLHESIYGLTNRRPEYSARTVITTGQVIWALLLLILLGAGFWLNFKGVATGLFLLLTMFYLISILLRAELIAGLGKTASREAPLVTVSPEHLPVYSVMLALYEEVDQVEELCRHLQMIDWPADKLDIKLVCEADDIDTIAAIRALDLPKQFEIVLVPCAAPRTKPKALSYALPLARGDYVVLYDAEDRPSPGQLKEAYVKFLTSPADLACLQAPLHAHNGGENWLCCMFALEYLTLFNGILPVLAHWKAPLPLGGTSNHFKTDVLRKIGGWDPYNVTEDADLGIRLAREGYRSATITSPTYEEAPPEFIPWMTQRTRWIKGWIQTVLVHTRNPIRFIREVGIKNAIIVHLLLTSLVVSVLVHPFFMALFIYQVISLLWLPNLGDGAFLLGVAIFNLVGGYSTYAMLAHAVHRRQGIRLSLKCHSSLPFYWLLISAAGWRALLHLMYKPHHWEKTPHGLSTMQFRFTTARAINR